MNSLTMTRWGAGMQMHGKTIFAGSAVALSLMGTVAAPVMAHGVEAPAVEHAPGRAGAA